MSYGKDENRKKIRKYKITIDRLDGGRYNPRCRKVWCNYVCFIFSRKYRCIQGDNWNHNPCGEFEKEFLEENTFEVSGQNYNKISYIYGANGSGKTNYLAALTKMQKMIIMSTVLGANNNKLLEVPAIKKELAAPIETFKFDIDCKSKETYFEIQVIIEEILYTYSFAIQDGKIQKSF